MAKKAEAAGKPEAAKPPAKSVAVTPVRVLPPAAPVESEFDRIFDRMLDDFRHFSFPSLLGPERWWPSRALRMQVPAVDVYEDKDAVVVKADLPGMSKDEIEVSLTGSALTLKGEKRKAEEIKDHDYYRSERSYGAFSRTLALPADIKSDQVTASFKDGVLEIRLPKTEEAKKKQIKVAVQ
ncbi:MAG: Hsp20/alpha crystallin family protein [Deltaproteobacteria bacterium]|nr:Hsp20/alpha crystallin family protein [Deltaproteobacteria bacterium]